MMDTEALCMGCMTTQTVEEPCPRCGYAESAERTPNALAHRAVLNDRFIVGRVLGKPGGFGITYLAWDLTLHTTAAIKEYLPQRLAARHPGDTSITPHTSDEQSHFAEGMEKFLDEARTVVRFSHPNLVRVRDYFAENNSAYLVMDYYDGYSLSEHLLKKVETMPESEALDVMCPILEGLAKVHELGFLHRDIKPANIYLTEQNTPVLLDFGAARQSLGEETESLSVVLTPGYAPFEQYFRKGKQGPWTDVYACAATLYFALSGARPPPALDRESEDELAPLRELNPNVSRAVENAIMAGLARSPDERPQTAIDFRDRLLGSQRSDRVSESASTIIEGPLHKRTATILYSLLGGLIVLLVLGIWTWFEFQEPPPPHAAGHDAPQWQGPPTKSGRKAAGGPPRESIDACRGASYGSACVFEAPHGQEQGRCQQLRSGEIACIPDHHRQRRKGVGP